MASRILISALLLSCLLWTCSAELLFSSLEKSLVACASPKHGEVLQAGESKITVSWGLNHSFPSTTTEKYKTTKVKLCFAPVSQKDRDWRETNDELSRDKTCQITIVERPYKSKEERVEWLVPRNIPEGTYFVRVYVFDSDGHQVGYGQTTNGEKSTNLFKIQGINGRVLWVGITAGVFSAFSVLGLVWFYYREMRG